MVLIVEPFSCMRDYYQNASGRGGRDGTRKNNTKIYDESSEEKSFLFCWFKKKNY